ncbi:hypothetical protein [Brevundimonas sp. GCM10030266]|uniref:hypothetical protein n=1 Tax=Brevundimonas sp. GCM10030266 TaxID=3273386 RepID=UPI00360D8718
MPRILILMAGLALAACTTTPEPVISAPVLDPCPASATAALEPRPGAVPVTEDERLALDVGGIRILGADRFSARELSEAQKDARTARLESRIEQTRRWCAGRRPDPG